MSVPLGKRTVFPSGTRKIEVPDRKYKPDPIHCMDPQEAINVCLSCTQPLCPDGNCKAVRTVIRAQENRRSYVHVRDEALLQRRWELYQAGWDDKRIASATGSTKSAVRSWRKRRDLPEHPPQSKKIKKGENKGGKGNEPRIQDHQSEAHI